MYEAFADGKTSEHLDWSHVILKHRLLRKSTNVSRMVYMYNRP